MMSHVTVTEKWEVFVASLDEKCIIMAPFCETAECEDIIKKESAKYVHMTSLR